MQTRKGISNVTLCFVATIVLLLLMLIVPALLPVILYFTKRGDAFRRWTPDQIGTQSIAGGGFRDAEIPAFGAEGPPKIVQVAAVGAWTLGQMFVPGLAAGLFGLLFLMGLVSIPGLILAARLFLLGGPLLRGEPEAASKARSLARFARILNVIVVAVSLLGTGVMVSDALQVNHGLSRFLSTIWMPLSVLVYAAVSFVHAWTLDRAADAIDRKTYNEQAMARVRVAATDELGWGTANPQEQAVVASQSITQNRMA